MLQNTFFFVFFWAARPDIWKMNSVSGQYQTKTFPRPLPSSCTASPVSGGLLLRSLGRIGFRDVTKINLAVTDRAHGERKRPSN